MHGCFLSASQFTGGTTCRSAFNIIITRAVPVIAVSDSVRAEEYYCRVLGFQKMFAYRPDTSKRDPCYLGVARDGVWLHLQSFKRERAGMTDAFLWVADVDLLHEEISARGAVVQLPPTNQTWGTRETGIRDPDGNVLVFATKRTDTNAPPEGLNTQLPDK